MPLARVALLVDLLCWPYQWPLSYALNIIIHGINCGLLYLLLAVHMGCSRRLALFAACFMAISPAAVPLLFTVSARPVLLSLLCLITCIMALLRHHENTSALALGTSLVLWTASLLFSSWSLLALGTLIAASASRGIPRIVSTLPHSALTCLYAFAFLADIEASTVATISNWSPSRLFLAVFPFTHETPRLDMKILLCGATVIVAALAMKRLRWSPLVPISLCWFLPVIAAVPASAPDPLGLRTAVIYALLPGLALMAALCADAALRIDVLWMRHLAGILLAVSGSCYLHISSTYAFIIKSRAQTLETRVASIAELIRERRDAALLVCADTLPPERAFLRASASYLDPLLRCYLRDRALRQHVIEAGGGYLWEKPDRLPSVTLTPTGLPQLFRASITKEARLRDDPGIILARLDEDAVTAMDLESPREAARHLAYRYPEWTTDLPDWEARGLTMSPVDGAFRLACSSTDPQIVSPQFRWSPAVVEEICVVMMLEKPGRQDHVRVYWEAGVGTGFDEDHAVNIAIPPAASLSLTRVSGSPASNIQWLLRPWVTRLRLDPPEGSTVRVASIALAPSPDPTPRPAEEVELLWDGVSTSFVNGGSIETRMLERASDAGCYISDGEDPSIEGVVKIDPMMYDTLHVRMRYMPRAGPSERRVHGQLYWSTSTTPGFNELHRMDIQTIPDGAEHDYSVRLTRHFLWFTEGEVTAIRIDPIDTPGSICISRVELSGPGPEAHTPSLR